MANITLAIPEDVYRRMRRYREIRWSEVARRAILEYLRRLEEGGFETTTDELLRELGDDFRRTLERIDVDKAVEAYREMREAEWRRTSLTQVD